MKEGRQRGAQGRKERMKGRGKEREKEQGEMLKTFFCADRTSTGKCALFAESPVTKTIKIEQELESVRHGHETRDKRRSCDRLR